MNKTLCANYTNHALEPALIPLNERFWTHDWAERLCNEVKFLGRDSSENEISAHDKNGITDLCAKGRLFQ